MDKGRGVVQEIAKAEETVDKIEDNDHSVRFEQWRLNMMLNPAITNMRRLRNGL